MFDYSLRPMAPPPDIKPAYCRGMEKAAQEFLKQYVGLYVYVFLNDGKAFWIFPVEVSDGDVLGYAWKNDRWQLISINLSSIKSFI